MGEKVQTNVKWYFSTMQKLSSWHRPNELSPLWSITYHRHYFAKRLTGASLWRGLFVNSKEQTLQTRQEDNDSLNVATLCFVHLLFPIFTTVSECGLRCQVQNFDLHVQNGIMNRWNSEYWHLLIYSLPIGEANASWALVVIVSWLVAGWTETKMSSPNNSLTVRDRSKGS